MMMAIYIVGQGTDFIIWKKKIKRRKSKKKTIKSIPLWSEIHEKKKKKKGIVKIEKA